MSREDKAQWVRDNLPLCAEFAAAIRSEFPDARMVFVSEAGHTIGTPTTGDGVTMAETCIGPVVAQPLKRGEA